MIEFLLLLVIYSIEKKLCVGSVYIRYHIYGTKRFLSSDDLIAVVGAGGGMSSVGTEFSVVSIILKNKYKRELSL